MSLDPLRKDQENERRASQPRDMKHEFRKWQAELERAERAVSRAETNLEAAMNKLQRIRESEPGAEQ